MLKEALQRPSGLDSMDFIARLRRTIHDFEERLFKSKWNVEEIKRILKHFMKTPLYARNETRQDPLLVVVDKENRVMKRNHDLQEAGAHLQEILKVSIPTGQGRRERTHD